MSDIKRIFDYTYTKIVPGTYLWPKALNWFEQKALVKLYKRMSSDLYVPKLKSGHSMNLSMTCLGKHWSPRDYAYHETRVDHDQNPVKEVPEILLALADWFAASCLSEYECPDNQLMHNAKTGWNIALCNYYNTNSTLGLHRDDSETPETLQSGFPIVSFSIGASCDFLLGGLKRSDPTQKIQLHSGDILIMGGPSRLRYHGVSKIHRQNNDNSLRIPFSKALGEGRINFTLRKL